MKINKPLSILITIIILLNVSALLELQVNAQETAIEILRLEISNVLDEIFDFDKWWMIRFVKVEDEVKPYLIVPMDITPEDKDKYIRKELELIWK